MSGMDNPRDTEIVITGCTDGCATGDERIQTRDGKVWWRRIGSGYWQRAGQSGEIKWDTELKTYRMVAAGVG